MLFELLSGCWRGIIVGGGSGGGGAAAVVCDDVEERSWVLGW